MGEGFFIAANALALVTAWCLARFALPASRPFERTVATVVGLPLVVLPTATLLGAFGLLNARAAVVAVAAEACLAVLLTWRRARGTSRDETPSSRACSTVPTTALEAAALGTALGIALYLAWPLGVSQLLRGYRPQWDDLSYHGPMTAHWLQAERLVLAPFSYHAYYAGNAELFAAWLMLPTRLDAYAALAGGYWLLLSALSLAYVVYRLAAGPAASALSGVLLLFCRPFAEQAGSFAATDLAGAALCLAAIALASPSQPDESAAMSRGRVFYAGCLSGLATGTKVTYAPLAVLVLCWLLWKHEPGLRRSSLWTLFFSLCALLCGGYWYGRNFVLCQNPLFPADLGPFSGPLDAATRKTTSLVFQLDRLSGAALRNAVWDLLDWPTSAAFAFLGAYAATVLALPWPRLRRQPAFDRAVLLLVAGAIAILATAAGPFSGTANSRAAQLLVRLRFFLLFALCGLALASYWIGRTGKLRPWLTAAAALFVGRLAGAGWQAALASLALGASFALAAARGSRRWLLPQARFLALGAFVVVPWLASLAMRTKEPENVRIARSITPAWNAVDALPTGARVTWFSTFEPYKYYRAFGPGLIHVPVVVQSNGQRHVFMHEGWSQSHTAWWRPRRRKRALPPPAEPQLEQGEPEAQAQAQAQAQATFEQQTTLISNLQALRIDYVLVMRRRDRPWPGQYALLAGAHSVHLVATQRTFALFRLPSR